MSSASSLGSRAMGLLPQSQLCNGQGLPFARGTNFLPCTGCRHRVIKTQLAKHRIQVLNVNLRSKAFATTRTPCSGIGCTFVLIKLDPELGRPLKDVKELSKGK